MDRSTGVLICDDVDAIRLLLRVIIKQKEGLHVVGEATDGNEAVSEARRLQPDVILLDLSMPVRTGLDALPEIKQVAPDAKVIVLSAFSDPGVVSEALALGADRYIEKGVESGVIIDAIQEMVAHARLV